MSRPPELPKFDTMGERVKWWRLRRDMTPQELARAAGQKYSTIKDLESGRTKKSKITDILARVLRINAHYLRTDKGDPEAPEAIVVVTDEPPESSEWPLDSALLAELLDLDEIEQGYFQAQAKEVLQTIKTARGRRRQKHA